MTTERRTLQYTSLDNVIPDVERLMLGHLTVGNWSLAEICRHLAGTIRLAVDTPATTRHDPALQFPQEKIDQVFESGKLPEGLPRPAAASSTLPEPINVQDAANLLRDAIAYYAASPGPASGHRFLGPLSKDQWDRLQRIHCAHHLSFAIPSQAE